MKQTTSYRSADGEIFDFADEGEAESFRALSPDAKPISGYRADDGSVYDFTEDEAKSFTDLGGALQPLHRISFADGSSKDMTVGEMAEFLRSDEYRNGERYAADRDETAAKVAERMNGVQDVKPDGLATYADGLADAGGTAIGRTIGGALSRFAKFTGWLAANARPMGTEGTLSAQEFHPEAQEPDIKDAGAPIRQYKNSVGRSVAEKIDGVTDILFPNEQKTDSAVAQAVGKAVGLGAGLAEFALTPTALLAGGHFVEGMEEAYDATKARGGSDEEAVSLGMMRGAVDGGVTALFKNAPTHRILGALGYKPAPAVAAAIEKAGEKGIFGVTKGGVAAAVGKQMLMNAAIAANEMGYLGGLQGFIDDAIMQEAATGKIDWGHCWEVGRSQMVEQGAFGAVMGLLPTPIKVREAVKQRNEVLSKALKDPMGAVAYAQANPKAGDVLAQAWRKDGKVSRKVAEEAGLPEMDEAARNEIGEIIATVNDAKADVNRVKVSNEQYMALSEEVAKRVGTDQSEDYGKAIIDVLGEIKDAKELDDPYRREELVGKAVERLYADENARAEADAEAKRAEREARKEDAAAAFGSKEFEEQTRAREEREAQNRAEVGVEGAGARAEAETGKEKGVATEGAEAPSRADGEVVGKAGDESAQKKYTTEEAAALKKKGKAVPEDQILNPEDVEANKETREEKPDETGNGAAEEPAKPEQGVERPEGKPEAPRPLAGAEKGGKAPDEGVAEPSAEEATSKIDGGAQNMTDDAAAFRDAVKGDPTLRKIDAAFKKAKTDAERNALRDAFEARVKELQRKGLKVPKDAAPAEPAPKDESPKEAEMPSSASDAKPSNRQFKQRVIFDKTGMKITAKIGKALSKEEADAIVDALKDGGVKGSFVMGREGRYRVSIGSSDDYAKAKAVIDSLNPKTKAEIKAEKDAAEAAERKRLRDADNAKFLADHKEEADVVAKMGFANDTQRRAVVDAMLDSPTNKQWARDLSIQSGKVSDFLRKNGVDTDAIKTPEQLRDALRSFISKPVKAESEAEQEEKKPPYSPSKELVEAKSRIEAMPTDTERQVGAKKKAQKDWLLSSIDDAINSHGNVNADVDGFIKDYGSLLRRLDATWDGKKIQELKEQIAKARERIRSDEMITFDVPDDGTFKVYNTPEALAIFKRNVQKRLSPTALKEGTISKAERPLAEDIKESGVGMKVGEADKPKNGGNQYSLNPDYSPLKPEAKGAKAGSKKAQEGKNAKFGWEMGREVELDPSETKSERNPLGQVVVPEEGSVAQSIDKEIAADEALAAKGRGKAQGTPPAPAPGSAGNARLNPDYEPESIGAGVKDPVARQQIVDRFKELFGDKAAIRGPNTTGVKKGAAGQYEPKSGNIRSKDPISMRTIPHEIGHHIDASLKRMGIARPPAVRHELIQLGQKLYGSKKPTGGYEAEGFAEMLKYYMQGNEEGLKKESPEAYRWLKEKFAKADPDTFAKLDEMRDMIDTLQNQSGEQAVRAWRAKDPTLMERMKKSIAETASSFKSGKLYNHWVDKFGFIGQAMKRAGLDKLMDWQGALKRGDKAAANEMFRNNPVVKAKLYGGGGRGRARAEDSYENGLRDLASASRYLTYGDLGITTPGHAANEPLPVPKDIFASFSKAEKDAFQDYAIARIAKEAYLDKGLEFGLTLKEITPTLRKYANNQKFKDALERYTHYKHGVLHLLVDAGAMSQKQFEAIVAANPIYVKIARRRDGADLLRNSIMKRGGKVVNKRTGGGGQGEDIFAAGLADDARVFNAAMQADLMRSLIDLGKRGEAAGGVEAEYFTGANWLREVPNAQGNVKFTAEKLRKQITDAMVNQGVAADKADAKTIFDKLFDDGEDTLSIFKEKPSNGKNGVVSIYDQEGKLHTYELPTNGGDAWAEALFGFTSPDNAVVNQVGKLGKVGSVATGLVRAGATTYNMGFAAFNIVRDSTDSSIYNEYGTYIPYIGSVQGLVNDMMGSNAAKNYKALALGMGTITGKDRLASAKKADKYVMSKTWYERAWNRGVLHTVADILGHGEDASRIKNFKNAYDWAIKQGLDADVASMLAGCHALDQSIDFGRSGLYGGTVNKFVPFFNAGIQGFEHFIRMHGLRDAEPWQYQNDRKKIAARTVAKGIAAITMPTLLATVFNMTDDDRKRKEFERDAYNKFCFMNFGDFRLPVPFENGFMYGSLVKAAIYEAMGDKGALKDCFSIMRKVLSPVDVGTPHEMIRNIAIFSGIADTLENKKWDGRPIVPEYMMHGASKVPSYMWANKDTSKAARTLGKFLSNFVGEDNKIASPAIIENFFDVHTGGLFSKIAKTIEGVAGDGIDLKRPNTWPVVGRFFHNTTNSRVIGDFYERREQLIMRKNGEEASKAEIAELDAANKIATVLKELRKRAERVRADKTLTVTGRNDRLDEITKKMQEAVRRWDNHWKSRRKK